MQRSQRRGSGNRRKAQRIQSTGSSEMLAAMHHAVADSVQLAASGGLHQGQYLGEGGTVIGMGQDQAVFTIALLPVDLCIRAAQAFGQTTENKGILVFVDQGKLDR